MGRKGDIVSKVIGVRAPIKTYTKLLNEASDKGISLSEHCVYLLSKDNFNQGGQTRIEYRDRIIEKKILNPELLSEIETLKGKVNQFQKLIMIVMDIKEARELIGKHAPEDFTISITEEELREWSKKKP